MELRTSALIGLLGVVLFAVVPAHGQNASPQAGSNQRCEEYGKQYVSPGGKDTNDGCGWSSAKATVFAALEGLPGGSASPPTAGTGALNVAGTVPYGGSIADGGLWLMGNEDAAYPKAPLGWLLYSGPLDIECTSPNSALPNGHIAVCAEKWGGNEDDRHPSYWFSGTAKGLVLSHFQFQYPWTVGKIGISAANTRTGSGAQSVTLDGVGGNINCDHPGGNRKGPNIDIGSNVFWLWLINGQSQACEGQYYPVISVSVQDGVGKIVTEAATDFHPGDQMTLENVKDSSFDSYASGTYTISSCSAGAQTICAFRAGGPNRSSSGGWAFGDRAAAINIDPGNSSGAGLIYIEDYNLQGGGIRYTCGTASWGLTVKNITEEGNYSDPMSAAVLFTNANSFGNAHIDTVQIADNIPSNVVAGVENDNPGANADDITADAAGFVLGPMIVHGLYHNTIFQEQTVSPLEMHEAGTISGVSFGQSDAARRLFGPVAVLAPNLASTYPGNWSALFGSGTVVGGQLAPDGTHNAGLISWSKGGEYAIGYYRASPAPVVVGDYYVFGAWTQSATGNGYFRSSPLQFTLTNDGYGAGDTCTPQSTQHTETAYLGQKKWDWTWGVCEISTSAAPAGIALSSSVDATHSIAVYGPVVMRLPKLVYTRDEAWNVAANLASFDSSCLAGTVCGLRGQELIEFRYGTLSNCTSSTSPARCGEAASGAVAISPSSSSVVVQTAAVTSNSEIAITFNAALSDRLRVKCSADAQTPFITAINPGVSFTISVPSSFSAVSGCFTFTIEN